MRWDRFFDDLEDQLASEWEAERAALDTEAERLRLSRVQLSERLTLLVARDGASQAVASFDLAETIPDPGHRTLVLRLAQNAGGGQTLGKFRVSVLAVEKKFPEKWTDQYSNLLNILK